MKASLAAAEASDHPLRAGIIARIVVGQVLFTVGTFAAATVDKNETASRVLGYPRSGALSVDNASLAHGFVAAGAFLLVGEKRMATAQRC